MRIQTKLLVVLVALLLATGTVAIVVTQNLSRSILKGQIHNHLETTAQSRAQHVETFLAAMRNEVDLTGTSFTLTDFLAASPGDGDYAAQYEAVNQRLRTLLEASDEFSGFTLLDSRGIVVATTEERLLGWDRSVDPVFTKGRERTHVADVQLSRISGEPFLPVAAPIKSNQELLGVVVASVAMTKLDEITTDRTGLGETGEIYLVNRSGYMITPSRFLGDASLTQLVDTGSTRSWVRDAEDPGTHQDENEPVLYENYLGEVVLGVHTSISEVNWLLVAEQSAEEAFAPVAALTGTIASALTFLSVCALALSAVAARTITRPVRRLHEGIEEIAKGNLDHRVGTRARDEIGELSRAFDRMTSELKASQERLEAYSKDLAEQVDERTLQLAEKVREGLLQRIAILNIAQDLGEANFDLKRQIAERLQAEEALRESEEIFRGYFELGPIGMAITSPEEKTWVRVNDRLCDMLGYSREELQGMTWAEMTHPEDLAADLALFDQILAGKSEGYLMDKRYIRKDGATIWATLYVRCLRNPDGSLRCMLVLAQDITERVRAEEALRRRDAILEGVSFSAEWFLKSASWEESINEVLGRLGAATGVSRVYVLESGTGEDRIDQPMTHYEWEAPGIDPWAHDAPVDDSSSHRWPFGRWWRTVRPGGLMYGHVRDLPENERETLSGHGILSFMVVPIFVADEWWGGLGFDQCLAEREWSAAEVDALKIAGDILGAAIQHRQTEDALRQEEGRAQRYLEVAGVMFLALDATGKVSLINRRGCEILGYEREEILGKNWFENFLPERVQDDVRTVFARIMAGQMEGVEYVEGLVLTKDGEERNVAWHNTMLTNEAGDIIGTLSSGEDITERVRAEQEKAGLEAQLLQAQRIEAIGSLAGGVAHDFNNILTAIQGYTELALGTIERDHPLYRDLNEVRSASLRAANLTRQLLLFSRRQRMTIVPLDLNRVIRNLTAMLERIIGEDVRLRTELESGLWPVEGDAGTIEQVIMNLVVNARDAMPEGGETTIKTENLLVDSEYCQAYSEARPGEFVRLSVVDTGLGIDLAIIDRIFEPFFTTKGPGKGSGMGLSVVYGIVKQHGGWVTVESSPGNGAAFRVYLPVASVSVEEECQAPPLLQEAPRGRGERILVVEDEESVREFVTKALTRDGYTIHAVQDVQSALEAFEKEGRDFDLIFSDVVLPDGRGPILAERLLELKPDVGVLLGSGYASDKSDWRLIQERGYPYLQKPYSLSELLATVRRVLEAR